MSVKNQGLKWHVHARVDKYDEGGNWLGYEEEEGNLITTAGLAALADAVMGANDGLSSTRVRIGVGDDATAANVADTDLSTTTNQYYRIMEATFPSRVAGVITFKAIFGAGVGNFAWNCWGLDMGAATVSSSGTVNTLINRKVAAFGTKSGGDWTLTVTLTLS